MITRKSAYQTAIDSSPRAKALRACSAASDALDKATEAHAKKPSDATKQAVAAASYAFLAAQAAAHTR